MTLGEISRDYREAADLMRQRLADLRSRARCEEDPDKLWHIKREIADLTPVLTQLNELAELTEHYYDKGYHRNEKYCF